MLWYRLIHGLTGCNDEEHTNRPADTCILKRNPSKSSVRGLKSYKTAELVNVAKDVQKLPVEKGGGKGEKKRKRKREGKGEKKTNRKSRKRRKIKVLQKKDK